MQRGELVNELHRLEADGNHFANEPYNVLRVVSTVRIIDNATTLIGLNLVLVNDPVERRTIAKPILKCFRTEYP